MDAAALFVGEAMHGQPLFTLPSLHGTDAPAETPAISVQESSRPSRGPSDPCVSGARGVVAHDGPSIAQTRAKTRHACLACCCA